MEGGFDIAEREAGLQLYGQCDGIDLGILTRTEHRCCDLLAVFDRIGRDGEAGAVIEFDGLDDRRRIVAGGDDHREAQRELTAGLVHRLLVFDLHDDGFAGADIGDLVGEDVGALLFQQGGLLALGLGLLVDFASFLARLDLAFDEAIADLHLQDVDGGIFRQREDVGALDPSLARVLEALGDLDAGDGTGDIHLDVGLQARRLDEEAGFLGGKEQRAAVDVVRLDQAGELAGFRLAFISRIGGRHQS